MSPASSQLYSLSTLKPGSDQALQLKEWFTAEWGEVDPYFNSQASIQIPAPIGAIKNGELIGGLSFTCAPKPGSEVVAVWVNALLVSTSYRRTGVGAALIEQAVLAAAEVMVSELFVHTDLPAIYVKQGWEALESESGSTVLKISLSIQ